MNTQPFSVPVAANRQVLPTGNESLTVRVHRGENDVTVIETIGELDLACAPALQATLLQAVGHGTVILHAAELTFCDVVGLHALDQARLAARTAGAALRIAAPSTALVRVMELAGVRSMFDVCPDVQTAPDD